MALFGSGARLPGADKRNGLPLRNPMECWSNGVMARWSNLATHLSAVLSAIWQAKADHLSQTVHQAQSSPIKPNQAIL
jgi:hypothetical protein